MIVRTTLKHNKGRKYGLFSLNKENLNLSKTRFFERPNYHFNFTELPVVSGSYKPISCHLTQNIDRLLLAELGHPI